ncbi:MAG TPA: histidine kinase [Pseudonocardiaceae bacterium]|nr:histidine kinase [Pseudonocardiaceae bacterium]
MDDHSPAGARSWWPSWSDRRGPLVAEIVVLALLVIADAMFALRSGPATGLLASITVSVTSGLGPVAAALAVLRRRLPDQVALLGDSVAALSLLGTALAELATRTGHPAQAQPNLTELAALALLVGAASRRLPTRRAAVTALLGGLAMVTAPVVRAGPNNALALLAVPAALLLGGALAIGLIHRDADARRVTALAAARDRVRTAERALMARELHDLVAHHITGVVVRAQAARIIADHPTGKEIFAEIEEAGAEALAATRRLVSLLRTGEPPTFGTPVTLREAVDRAIPRDGTVTLTTEPGWNARPVTPEVAGAAHRVLMEALTNIRRHAPGATEVRVSLRAESGQPDCLVADIVNSAAETGRRRQDERPGYGLVGMTERITALGGTLTAGPEPGGRWRVLMRLPYDPPGARERP